MALSRRSDWWNLYEEEMQASFFDAPESAQVSFIHTISIEPLLSSLKAVI